MRLLTLFMSLLFFGVATANSAPPPIEAYAQIPALRDGALSPNGKKLAVVTQVDNEYAVQIIDIVDMKKPKVISGKLPKNVLPRWIKWANNDRVFVSVRTTSKASPSTPIHFTTIMSISSDMKDVGPLIKQAKTRRMGSQLGSEAEQRQFNDYVIDWLPDDPDHILMGFSKKDSSQTDVQMVNVRTGNVSTKELGGRNTQEWITDLTGEVRLAQGRHHTTAEWQMRIRKAGESFFSGPEDFPGLQATSDVVGFTEDPDELLVFRYAGNETIGLEVYNLAQKKYTKTLFRHPEYDVSRVIYAPNGKKVLGAGFTSTHNEIEFFDPEAKALITEVKAKAIGYNIRYIDQTPDGKLTLLRAVSADEPSLMLLYNRNTKELDLIGNALPRLSEVTPAYVQPISYVARDGQKIPGFVTIPANAMEAGNIKNLPYIVFPHGGPNARDSAEFDYMAQMMASRGYAVLQMNFRGSTGYGRTFTNAGRDNWVIMQDDVEDGTKWLVEKGYADPDRICIMGWSYGGYAALMAAAKHGEMYQCTASIAGVTDLGNLMTDMQRYRFGRSASRDFILRGFKDKDDIKENSPLKLAEQIQIPVFLAHGNNDVVVHFGHFERMKKAMKRAGNAATTVEIKNGGHSLLVTGDERVDMMKKLVGFMEDNLGKSDWAN